jgi:hypothetical protein
LQALIYKKVKLGNYNALSLRKMAGIKKYPQLRPDITRQIKKYHQLWLLAARRAAKK